MKNLWFVGLCIFLLIIPPLYAQNAQEIVIATDYDGDNDGVCDQPQNKLPANVGRVTHNCDPLPEGDKCLITRPSSSVRRGGEFSGCADYEISRILNFWSVNVGELRPKRVKINWLTDQSGIEVYQPVSFSRNLVSGSENVKFSGNPTFFCRDVGDTRGLASSIPVYIPSTSSEGGLSGTMVFRLRQFREEDLNAQSILVSRNKKPETVNDIRLSCTATTHQCEVDASGKCNSLYPEETDEFDILIPIENLAIQLPDRALGVGITTSDFLIDKIDKVLGVVEKARFWSGGICGFSIGFVLLGKVVGDWFKWIEKISEKWWFGTGGLPKGDETATGGKFGGKAFCRYYACPASLCPFLKKETGRQIYTNEDGKVKVFDGKPEEINENIVKGPTSETYLDKLQRDRKTVQDSLVTSVACGCVTGVEQNLYKIKIILENWNRCLNLAKNDKRYVADCERYLSEMICTHVLGEFHELGKISFIGRFIDTAKREAAELLGLDTKSRSALEEVRDVQEVIDYSESGLRAAKNTFDKEITPIAEGHARGNLGYRTKGLSTALCEFALYQEIPNYDIVQALRINELKLDTSLSANWNVDVAYVGLEGTEPVYEYEISWTVISGFENYKYRLFLETDKGKKRYLPLRTNGLLADVGDIDSDYVQITDRDQYVRLCFDVPYEVNPLQCFPPGKFSRGSPFDLSLFADEDIDDLDGDRLPDAWEEKYNCNPNRNKDDFETEQDWKDCQDLINNKREFNVLNPNIKDSDGDGITDDKEDPDKDGFTNYFEFSDNFNPNVAGKIAAGISAEGICNVNLESISLVGGLDFGEKKRFNVNDNFIVTGEVSDAKPEDQIIVKTEITGPGIFFRESEFSLSQLDRGANLWKISDKDETGFYKLKVSFQKPRDFAGFDQCVNTNPSKTGFLAQEEIEFFVFNPDKGGCFDSDEGKNFFLSGNCFDGDLEVDSCGASGLIEWSCQENKCVSETHTCGDNLICSEGACVTACIDDDRNNDVFSAGTCRYLKIEKDKNGKVIKEETVEKADECVSADETKIKQYSCQQNQCAEQIDGCLIGNVCQNGICVLRSEVVAPAAPAPTPPISAPSIFEGLNRESAVNLLEQIPSESWVSIDQVESRVRRTFRNLQNLNVIDYINTKSNENRIPPLLTLAVITVESNGDQTAVSRDEKTDEPLAYGLMQIYHNVHQEYDLNKLKNDPRYNIDAGFKILNDGYSSYANDDVQYRRAIVGNCGSTFEINKRQEYTGWQRALRVYNGFGCTTNADNYFVEKVMVTYYVWSGLYPSLTA